MSFLPKNATPGEYIQVKNKRNNRKTNTSILYKYFSLVDAVLNIFIFSRDMFLEKLKAYPFFVKKHIRNLIFKYLNVLDFFPMPKYFSL